MSIRSYFMAKFYDAAMMKSEQTCLSGWRSDLLANTRGDVLEIGAGTGVNLQYYPTSVTNLVLSEPDPHMRRQLKRRIEESGRRNVTIVGSRAESIGFPDISFDCVVSTLVLCSVGDQMNSLKEIYRVLRPGGSIFFIEHVVAEESLKLVKWQEFFEPLWKFMCGNCHLTRDTGNVIKNVGFKIDHTDKVTIQGAPPVAKPTIKGTARRAKES